MNTLIAIRTAIPSFISSSSAYTSVSLGLLMYRWGIRSNHFFIDYSDDSGSTWELDLVSLEIDEELAIIFLGSNASYRKQIRSGDLMLDRVITGTGFAGIEDTDWENIYNTSVI